MRIRLTRALQPPVPEIQAGAHPVRVRVAARVSSPPKSMAMVVSATWRVTVWPAAGPAEDDLLPGNILVTVRRTG